MFYVNSANIDAAAMGFGPGTTCLPQISTGSPQEILAYVAQLIARIRRLESTLEDLERARDQMRQAWPRGPASDSAMAKLSQTFQTYQRMIQTAMSALRELEAAAVQLGVTQTGYRRNNGEWGTPAEVRGEVVGTTRRATLLATGEGYDPCIYLEFSPNGRMLAAAGGRARCGSWTASARAVRT